MNRYDNDDDDRDEVEISQKEQRKQQFNQKKRKMAGPAVKSEKIRLFSKGRSGNRPSTKDLINYGSEDYEE